ncbi:MAG: glycosyltransferase [Planctomycetales bacterium]|nr:glycosyltransferase [Planctomycetales bacterium]
MLETDERLATTSGPTVGRPVRICFVIENLLPAGTELWILRLIQHLDRRYVFPHLCLLDGHNETSRRLLPSNCPSLCLGMQRMRSRHGLKSASSFYRFLRTHKMDVVQVHHADPAYFAAPIARFARTRFVVQSKFDTGYWLGRKHLWLHRGLRPWIDVTVANSQASAHAAMQQEWSRNIITLENGIPMDKLLEIDPLRMPRTAPSPNSTPIRIGMVCNLRSVKRPETLLQAASLIRSQKTNFDLEYHFAGDGPLLEQLKSRTQEHRLQDCVHFHGPLDDVPGFLKNMHISTLTSESEGLSHSILEYLAAGRATVVSDVPGNRELVRHEDNGLLFPVGDAAALSDSLLRLTAEPDLAERLGRHGRASVADRYSLEAMVRRFETFYRELMHGN